MASAIHAGETGSPDTGTWVQAAQGHKSLVRVHLENDNEALVLILVSETDGNGIGADVYDLPVEAKAGADAAFFLPEGTYYINANIINNDTSVSVTVQN